MVTAVTVDTEPLIENGAAELGLVLPAGAARRLARYLELMRKWNRALNLTAITDPESMVRGHVLDSLAGSPWVEGRVLDIGSGAGLPGIPLAVAAPGRQVVLLDSRGKRIQFLIHARQALGLDNVTVIQARLEKYQPDGKFDTLTARAFAAFPELVRRATPFVKAGARLVAWQAGNPYAEVEDASAATGFRCAVHAVRVPGIGARHIVVVEGGGSHTLQRPSGDA